MHFPAEPAMENVKAAQGHTCYKYNHVANYCKTKQQLCARCSANHHSDQCSEPENSLKCYNCTGNHLATSLDCPRYLEQENRIKKMINQYSPTKQATTMTFPGLNILDEFPLLPNNHQRQQDYLHNVIIEETTNRLFDSIYQKIKRIEKSISARKNLLNEETAESEFDKDDEIQMLNDKNDLQQSSINIGKNKKQNNNPPTTSNATPTAPIASNETTIKPTRKQKETTQ